MRFGCYFRYLDKHDLRPQSRLMVDRPSLKLIQPREIKLPKKKKKRKILLSPEPVPVPVCDVCGKPAVVFDNWMDVNLCPKCAVIEVTKDREAS